MTRTEARPELFPSLFRGGLSRRLRPLIAGSSPTYATRFLSENICSLAHGFGLGAQLIGWRFGVSEVMALEAVADPPTLSTQ